MRIRNIVTTLEFTRTERGEASFYANHPSKVRYIITDCIPDELFLYQINVAGEDTLCESPVDGHWLSTQRFDKLLTEWESRPPEQLDDPCPTRMSLDLPTLQAGDSLKFTYSATRRIRVLLILQVLEKPHP